MVIEVSGRVLAVAGLVAVAMSLVSFLIGWACGDRQARLTAIRHGLATWIASGNGTPQFVWRHNLAHELSRAESLASVNADRFAYASDQLRELQQERKKQNADANRKTAGRHNQSKDPESAEFGNDS